MLEPEVDVGAKACLRIVCVSIAQSEAETWINDHRLGSRRGRLLE